jgi:predicted TPR repeat methyltransferase
VSGRPGALDTDALGTLYEAARAAEDAGRIEEAAALFHRCLAVDPDDHCGVTLRLAAHGLAVPGRAPPAYVATLFDQHAEVFDAILVDQLGYDVPALARRLAGPHLAAGGHLLDLGCGTGLAGEAFADIAGRITGVDLAEAMLAMADERAVYDALYIAEAVNFLEAWDGAAFDAIVATDVWPYLGDLAPFANAAARRLTDGGLLVASTERADGGWRVTPTHRFAHAVDAVKATLASAGLSVLAAEPVVVRHEEGVPVPGDLFLARR